MTAAAAGVGPPPVNLSTAEGGADFDAGRRPLSRGFMLLHGLFMALAGQSEAAKPRPLYFGANRRQSTPQAGRGEPGSEALEPAVTCSRRPAGLSAARGDNATNGGRHAEISVRRPL